MFCSNGNSSYRKHKDSLSNILSTKEFVVNFVTSETKKQMNHTSRDFKPNDDEFIFSKLKKKKSKLIKVPAVKNSPVNLECKLSKIIKLKTNSDKVSTMIIGEVIGIFINNKFIKKDRIDSVSMNYLGRMGYSEYTKISTKFNLKRS